MEEKIVWTQLGTIVGKTVNLDEEGKVSQFLGIPYAKPPTGELRFQDPQPLDKLSDDPFQANKYANCCCQQLDTTFGDFEGTCMWNTQNKLSEDCLYLNIWVPDSHEGKLPVMIWIYGGGFYNGSSSLPMYNGAVLAKYGDVIVVNFNYRTGVLGFFSTGDGIIKGNYGLKDQILAFKWVKRNISCFGGDPDNITVFGESAGSSSIGFHLMSPYFYKGLFHKAIFQSGSPKSRWSFMSKDIAKARSKIFLKNSGYTENNNEDLLAFLQNLDIQIIINNDWVDCGALAYPWVPTIDYDYLKDEPKNLLRDGKFQAVNSILGCNLHEGATYCLYDLPESFSIDNTSCLQSYDSFKNNEHVIDWDLPETVRIKIQKFYTDNQIINPSDKTANRNALEALFGDRGFIWPTVEFANALCSKGVNTYLYQLQHRATNDTWPLWMGIIHGADVQWVFGLPLQAESTYLEEEKEFSKTVINYFTNFAKSGNPNCITTQSSWPLYSENKKEFLSLTAIKPCIIQTNLRGQFCNFWSTIAEDLDINN